MSQSQADTKPTRAASERLRVLLTILVVVVLLTAVAIFLGGQILVEIFAHFVMGWALFLVQVVPLVRVDGGSILTGVVCVLLLVAGVQFFMRWIVRHWPGPKAGDGEPRCWRFRWTAAFLAVVVLLFLSGLSAFGLFRQSFQLLTSSERAITRTSIVLSSRTQSQNNLRQLGLAMQTHGDLDDRFLPGAIFDAHGTPLHGWNTLLLPYIEEANLYAQVDRTRPWHDPANALAFRKVVRSYQYRYSDVPTHDAQGLALTHYAANAHVISGDQGMPLARIREAHGLSTTLLAGEVASKYQPWGQPINWRDPTLGLNRSPDGFGNPTKHVTFFLWADGSARPIHPNVDPRVLRAVSVPDGYYESLLDQKDPKVVRDLTAIDAWGPR